MALTDEQTIAEIRSKYSISDEYTELTVYRSTTATPAQLARQYLFEGTEFLVLWGSRVGIYEEVVVAGQHVLKDADGVFAEYKGEI